ncbi:SrfA family protein [Musicola paradisiaca]|uniref:Virulence effector protein n=1 Tax=Musicola paradisiaca (strain Ech703) TaxID=579405 RepID=C6C564_MUSP7|nr:SrfA family protein [Musicola paradisiaca]ACS85674.1 putative virulence effector protein [Musicola paradisiaca Ech703]
MAKLFLRSGNLDDFLALGENGQPVYLSALQLRETLRLRKQQSIADCLAIPQSNEDGDRIDWYSPFNGKITSWMAASDEQREQALALLEQYQNTVADISENAQRSEKSAQKLFGVLLAKAFQFPGANHVYLVDDKPVITFWGFVNLGKKSRADALECLRPVEPEPIEPQEEPIPEPQEKIEPTLTPAELPTEEPALEPEPVFTLPDTVAEPVPAALTKRRVWTSIWWLVPCTALLATLVFQIRGCVSPSAPEHPPATATGAKPEKRVLETPTPADKSTEPLPLPTLPLEKSSLAPAPALVPAIPEKTAEEKAAEAAAHADMGPAPKGALLMPLESVKMGSIRFLDGSWQAAVNVKNPLTGRPPVLKYQIRDGKGRVRFTYGEGITCQAEVEAGLHQSGNLVINSRYRARCSNGSRYPMPEIICVRQDASDIAECKGRYDADTVLPMTIKRESK